MPVICPLCLERDEQPAVVEGADDCRYYLCRNCRLIFVDPEQLPSREEETARYLTHENSIENEGYVTFLNRLLRPMLPFLDPAMRGLDFGSGPGATLSELVRREGIACEDYDPLFNDRTLEPPYDFILSTECFEHFHRPHRDIARICSLLRPGGLLGVMTEQWSTLEQFARWYYTQDRTHTSFYHEATLRFLCQRFPLKILRMVDNRVVIFQKVLGREGRFSA